MPLFIGGMFKSGTSLTRKFIGNNPEVLMKKVDNDLKAKIIKQKEEYKGKFKYHSLHCGGIILYDKPIEYKDRLITKTKNQIKYDKREVADNGHFKIDILSNRAIAILNDLNCTIDPLAETLS